MSTVDPDSITLSEEDIMECRAECARQTKYALIRRQYLLGHRDHSDRMERMKRKKLAAKIDNFLEGI